MLWANGEAFEVSYSSFKCRNSFCTSFRCWFKARSYTLSEFSIELMNCDPDLGMDTLRYDGALSSIIGGIHASRATSAWWGHFGGTCWELARDTPWGKWASRDWIAGRSVEIAYCVSWGRRGAITYITPTSTCTWWVSLRKASNGLSRCPALSPKMSMTSWCLCQGEGVHLREGDKLSFPSEGIKYQWQRFFTRAF